MKSTTQQRRIVATAIGALCISFSNLSAQSGGNRPAAGAASTASSMPRLTRVPFTHGLDTLIWRAPLAIAVSATGHVAVPGDFGTDGEVKYSVQILERSAKRVVSIGREGRGPGEMSGADQPFADARGFHIYDLAKRSVLHYSPQGTFLRESRPEVGERFISAIRNDSLDLRRIQRWPTSGVHPLLTRIPMKGASERVLATTANAFVLRALQQLNPPGQGSLDLPYAAGSNRYAVGDPWTYQIEVYDDGGKRLYQLSRNIARERRSAEEVASLRKSLEAAIKDVAGRPDLARPLRTKLDTLARETVPHFNRSGIWFDGAGRLWVVGARGDSTFADVFAGTRFLGRQMLPCKNPSRRIALQGEWLALLCDYAQRESAPFQLLLYYMGPPGNLKR